MITSNANRQMKDIIQLQKKAKTRYERRVFVVEGPRMVLEAPPSWVEKVYVSELFWPDDTQKKQLSNFDWEVVSESVMKAVSDTKTPQGILALVKMPMYTFEDLTAAKDPHLLALENIQDPGNLGTMIRTGEGAGVSGILMNRTTVDIFHPKTVRATMGSLYRVPFYITENLADSVMQLKEKGISCYGAHLKGAVSYDMPDYTKGTAFLIGNEGNGLSREVAELADANVRIPMEGNVESLNAAIAATLLMYEVHRQRRA